MGEYTDFSLDPDQVAEDNYKEILKRATQERLRAKPNWEDTAGTIVWGLDQSKANQEFDSALKGRTELGQQWQSRLDDAIKDQPDNIKALARSSGTRKLAYEQIGKDLDQKRYAAEDARIEAQQSARKAARASGGSALAGSVAATNPNEIPLSGDPHDAEDIADATALYSKWAQSQDKERAARGKEMLAAMKPVGNNGELQLNPYTGQYVPTPSAARAQGLSERARRGEEPTKFPYKGNTVEMSRREAAARTELPPLPNAAPSGPPNAPATTPPPAPVGPASGPPSPASGGPTGASGTLPGAVAAQNGLGPGNTAAQNLPPRPMPNMNLQNMPLDQVERISQQARQEYDSGGGPVGMPPAPGRLPQQPPVTPGPMNLGQPPAPQGPPPTQGAGGPDVSVPMAQLGGRGAPPPPEMMQTSGPGAPPPGAEPPEESAAPAGPHPAEKYLRKERPAIRDPYLDAAPGYTPSEGKQRIYQSRVENELKDNSNAKARLVGAQDSMLKYDQLMDLVDKPMFDGTGAEIQGKLTEILISLQKGENLPPEMLEKYQNTKMFISLTNELSGPLAQLYGYNPSNIDLKTAKDTLPSLNSDMATKKAVIGRLRGAMEVATESQKFVDEMLGEGYTRAQAESAFYKYWKDKTKEESKVMGRDAEMERLKAEAGSIRQMPPGAPPPPPGPGGPPPPQGPNPPPGGTDMGGGVPPMAPGGPAEPPPAAPPPGPQALPKSSAYDYTKPNVVKGFMEGVNEGGTGNVLRGAARLANDFSGSKFYTGEDWKKTEADQKARSDENPGFKAGLSAGDYINPLSLGPGGALANTIRGALQFGLKPDSDSSRQVVAGGEGAAVGLGLHMLSRYIPIPMVEKLVQRAATTGQSVGALASLISSQTGLTGAVIAPVLRAMMTGMNKEVVTKSPVMTHMLNALRNYGPRAGTAELNRER